MRDITLTVRYIALIVRDITPIVRDITLIVRNRCSLTRSKLVFIALSGLKTVAPGRPARKECYALVCLTNNRAFDGPLHFFPLAGPA